MKKILSILFSVFFVQFVIAQSAVELETLGMDQKQPNKKTVASPSNSIKGIPPGGLLMIPESGDDRVLAFDPQTGDLINEYYILDDASDFFSTPIQLIQSPDKTKLYVSDQLKDYVVEFDNDGNYIKVLAPAGGANPSILDNVRGICMKAGTDHILVTDGNHDAVIEFDGAGNLVGNFTSPGLVDPFDVLYWPATDQYLVCDISGSGTSDAVKVFDNSGTYVSDLIPNISFPEQVAIAPGGNILVATFSSPSGVYEYTPTGTFVGYYDVVGSCRGVYELPNGNMLVTSGDGVYEVSKTNTVVSVKYQVSGASFRFISYVGPGGNTVTFRVNMSEQTVAPEGVHIAGSFQGWDPAATAMTNMGNGIYIYNHTFSSTEDIQYRFINGDDWSGAETVPVECAIDTNRYLTVPEADTVLTAVCFSSCDPCDPQISVTFRVDMSQQTVAAEGVHIAGSFQDWDPAATEMIDSGNGIYTYEHIFYGGEDIEYKFVNGDAWGEEEIVPDECAMNTNRYMTVPFVDTVLTAVCYSSCDPCGPQVMVTFRVDMSEQTVSADGVHLAGDFQGWDPGSDEMTLASDNIYEISFNLNVEEHYQFKFINGNTWDGEESVPAECGEDNGVGGYNRFVNVPANDTTLTAFCFGSCDPCNVTPDEYVVTFRVDMSDETIATEGVHLAGSFQGWDPGATPMTLLSDNIYTADVTLYEGYMYEYKFINGNDWEGSETVPEECGMDDGQGGFNRYLEVPASDTTLVALCFSSCDTCIPTGLKPHYVKVSEKLSIYPNPFENQVFMTYTGRMIVDIEVVVFNALGKSIINQMKESVVEGTEWMIPSTENLTCGIYYISAKVTSNDGKTESSVFKIIKR